MREAIARRTWRHSSQPSRENGDPMTRTQEAHVHTRRSNWARKRRPLPRPNWANHRPRIQSSRTNKNAIQGMGKSRGIDTREFKRGRILSKRLKTRDGENERYYQEQWAEDDERKRRETRKRDAPERTQRINNVKTGEQQEEGELDQEEQRTMQKREQEQKTQGGEMKQEERRLGDHRRQGEKDKKKEKGQGDDRRRKDRNNKDQEGQKDQWQRGNEWGERT